MTEECFAYVLVEDEMWWNRRRSRNRFGDTVHAFVRRGRVGPKQAQKVLFYLKRPARQIRGCADFLERITGAKDELWNLYGPETVFESKDEYEAFVSGRNHVTFIRFERLEEFEKPISFDQFSIAAGLKRMPQTGKYLGRETVNSLLKRGVTEI